MRGTFQMVTDTATLCLYDLAALKHRAEDTSDWWSIPVDELAEVNAGHCLFLNLGADGVYEVEWSLEDVEEDSDPDRGTGKGVSSASSVWARLSGGGG
ncbi:DUF6386 family protein [Paenibacillus sp. M2]|uniref:DUF6386 family protein n=1 Tax=Paenibacillus sp. M2 TaxID=3341793 RepID=UPI003988B8F9